MFQPLKLGSQPNSPEVKSGGIGYVQECLVHDKDLAANSGNQAIKQEGSALGFGEQRINKKVEGISTPLMCDSQVHYEVI